MYFHPVLIRWQHCLVSGVYFLQGYEVLSLIDINTAHISGIFLCCSFRHLVHSSWKSLDPFYLSIHATLFIPIVR